MSKGLADASDARIRQEFGRIQQLIAGIICNDVLPRSGVYFNGFAAPPNDEIEHRLIAQGDHRRWCSPVPTKAAQEEEVIDGMCCLLSTVDELMFINYIRKLTCASKVVEPPCVIDAI